MRKAIFAALALLLGLGGAPLAAQSGGRCFPETGLCVDGRLLQFWGGNGGLPVFGLPISEQRQEPGSEGTFVTQWFERERFELHPENAAPYDVLLGRLGDELLRRQGRDWRGFPPGQPQDGCLFFEETGHALCEPFLGYWRANGLEFDGRAGASYVESLALFGLPLSEPMTETNSSGFTVLTQWFERARFEYLPQNPDPYKVLLGRLGAEAFDPAAGNGPTQYHAVQQPGWPRPLEVPLGFTIEEVAAGLSGPRFLAVDPADGSLLVPEVTAGRLTRLRDADGDGRYEQSQLVADGFAWLHSAAFAGGQLYAADEQRLVRLSGFDGAGRATRVETILDLPSGATDLYGHRTRTVLPGPDGKLYVSVGSSCDVCVEGDPRRATILRLDPDGGGLEAFAGGLRNTVGFDWRPFTNELWGVDMGRNNIGAGLPPDELNRIEQGRDYGWPYCYGDRVPNPEFNDPARCAPTVPPALELPAHWAPLGMVFYNRYGFPAAYQGDALVAFHGTAPDQVQSLGGYNVARVRFRNGQPTGMEDLVRGWLSGGRAWGRPCGLALAPDGSLLISDDSGGRIFRLRYVGR